jgi:hypothetical protein
VIRRGFWLAVGAATGIYGYRRVSAAGRRLSASLNPASLNPASLNPASLDPAGTGAAQAGAAQAGAAQIVRQGRRTVLRAARETYRFTRDVREGMDLYMARHSEPPDSTLDTNHDPRPKDGH